MKRKTIISLILAAAMFIPCLPAAASVNDTRTYYFLAPDEWFSAEYGAPNEDVGCYWWKPEENAAWPGMKMTPVPEIGENVFKITDVPKEATAVIFNSFVDAGYPADPALEPYAFQSSNISTEGYDGDCPYDSDYKTDNFDGMIYVIQIEKYYSGEFEWTPYNNGGAWFTLDDYKNHDDYYGTYDLDQQENSYTYYFLAPDEYIGSDGNVGAYWWTPEETAEYPGVKMKRESDIGENVFSVEVPSTTTAITFNAYITPESNNNSDYDHYDTVNIDLSGYKKGSNADNGGCPYNDTITTDNFNGWIFVINHNDPIKDLLPNYHVDQGAWFTLDDYKNYDDYYGTYNFEQKKNTCTYYFLAPDEWFSAEYGALNEDVGCFWWQPEENAAWPGLKMTPAPEVGENVYKITDVPKEATTVIFNSFVNAGYPPEPTLEPYAFQSSNINTEGYDGDCPYDSDYKTDNFDGMIFVLQLLRYPTFEVWTGYAGAWFTLDDYKNHDDYYGTYNFEQKKNGCTYYFAAPDDWVNTEKGAPNSDVGAVLLNTLGSADDNEISTLFPGEKMTPAPEVGENVFKIENVPYIYDAICFCDYTDSAPHRVGSSTVYTSDIVSTRGYQGGAPYHRSFVTTTFDNMIYVLDRTDITSSETLGQHVYGGAWFTLDEYTTNEKYYGSYNANTRTYYFLAPSDWSGDIVLTEKNQPAVEGTLLTPAFDIGANVYKAEGVSDKIESFRFEDNSGNKTAALTAKGYSGDCPYDKELTTDDFNNMIYVLDGVSDVYGEPFGAWFTLEDYKDHPEYYGKNGIDGVPEYTGEDPHADIRNTVYFLAPDSWIKREAGAENDRVGVTVGEHNTVEYEMTPAPEVGENVYKFTWVSANDISVEFNDCSKRRQKATIGSEQNGKILVMRLKYFTVATRDSEFLLDKGGASHWCTLDDYKTDDYYASYELESPVERTYYFLAPDSWFVRENGALNEDIACCTETCGGNEIKLTPAPEVGRNVFKAELTKYDRWLCFDNAVYGRLDDSAAPKYDRCTKIFNIGRYGKLDENTHTMVCPYDTSVKTESFDGMIYVLDCRSVVKKDDGSTVYDKGAWFTLEKYKKNSFYYGTYGFVTGEADDCFPLFADIDGDGAVTSNDALEILRFSAGFEDSAEQDIIATADFDGDSVITSADALAALRVSAA